jgi:hypothetical protein
MRSCQTKRDAVNQERLQRTVLLGHIGRARITSKKEQELREIYKKVKDI